MSETTNVLVTVSGPDHPGITARLTAVLDAASARLCDIEQFVVHGQLTLALLLELDAATGTDVLKELLFEARELDLDLRYDTVGALSAPSPTAQHRYAITAIADEIGPRHVQVLAETLAKHGANIAAIERLSEGGLHAIEVRAEVDEAADPMGSLRSELLKVAIAEGVDLAVQREGLTRRSKRLVVFDMDSTLIQVEVIDELARAHGVGERVSAITADAMGGRLDYAESLRLRVALLEGLSYGAVLDVANNLPLTEGALSMVRVLKRLGYTTAVISGGFDVAADQLKERLGLDYAYSNTLEVVDGNLTGRVVPPVVTPERKAELLASIAEAEGVPLDQTIAIGDGANDMRMIERAGLGIAFHAKPTLRAAADTALTAGGLDRVLYLLGFRASDIRELLAD